MPNNKIMREVHRLALLPGADARHRPMADAQLGALRTLLLLVTDEEARHG